MDDAAAEIAIAAAVNVGTLLWVVATIKANAANLTGWVKSIDATLKETHDLAVTTSTRVDDLPCRKPKDTASQTC
jgi:hypothetical protein